MRRHRRRLILLVLTSVLPVAATLHAPAAEAFPYSPSCATRLKNVWYYFEGTGWDDTPASGNGWNGSTSYRAAATAGFELWDTDLNRDGSQMATLSPTTFTGATKVTVKWADLSGAYADFNCAGTIRVDNATKTESMAGFRKVLAHEMGHALGPDHTDGVASFTSVAPLMSTCTLLAAGGYTVDDAASLTNEHAIGAARTITANYGFEDGLDWWNSSGATPTLTSGGTSGGSNQIMVVPNSTSDNVHQTVNLSLGSGHTVRPSMQYATPGATSGQVRIQLHERDVAYASDSGNPCFHPVPDVDMNDRIYEEAWEVVLDKQLPLSGSWTVGQTDTARTVPSTPYGTVDYLVRVFSTAAVSTGYIHTHYDDLRIQEG